jgi:hypothetical protein
MNRPLPALAFAGALSIAACAAAPTTLTLVVAVCATSSAFAQAPSWNSPDGRNSSLSKPPPSGVVSKSAGSAVAVTLQPPRDVDCKATITKPETPDETRPTKWYTDGTEDHGQILNSVGASMIHAEGQFNQMQVRIEQLRCEEQNLEAKLDFIIRMLMR